MYALQKDYEMVILLRYSPLLGGTGVAIKFKTKKQPKEKNAE